MSNIYENEYDLNSWTSDLQESLYIISLRTESFHPPDPDPKKVQLGKAFKF